MEEVAVNYSIIDEGLKDISNYKVTSHAIMQYSLKCHPEKNMLDIVRIMKKSRKEVIEIKVCKKKDKKETVYYLDKEGCIYVTQNNTIITTYPNKRIFVAKTLYSNKKAGSKYL